MQLEYFETLIGIAELAVALAGFSGVVVAFGSGKKGRMAPGRQITARVFNRSQLNGRWFRTSGPVTALFISEISTRRLDYDQRSMGLIYGLVGLFIAPSNSN